MPVNLLLIPTAILYLLIVGALYVYGINFYYLTVVALGKTQESHSSAPQVDTWPHVTVQLPIYNEMHVACRLIEASAELDYPADRLQIQVLDDSTDETVTIVSDVVERLQAKGIPIEHVRRISRDGYKAGALRDGLKHASGELIAIFDADFIPTRDFLKETVPYFENEGIAFVQARWDHTNRNYSLLTFLQSLSIDAHFMVEQFSRSRAGFWFNFNGTAGVWRREAIQDAGGWQAHTLTEDLDLSYRSFMRGWEAVYLRDVTVPAELPVTFTAFRRQQHRWARGSLENAVILLPKIWRRDLPLHLKLQGTLHLTGYVVHLLLFALCLLYPLVVVLSAATPNLVSLFGIALLFNATALAPTLFFAVAQIQLKRKWWKLVPGILFSSAFGCGMMLNTVRAALSALLDRSVTFERTPKYGITTRSQSWKESKYQLQVDGIVFWEILFALFNLASCVLAVSLNHWFIAFYTLLFAVGLLFNAFYTLGQSIHVF